MDGCSWSLAKNMGLMSCPALVQGPAPTPGPVPSPWATAGASQHMHAAHSPSSERDRAEPRGVAGEACMAWGHRPCPQSLFPEQSTLGRPRRNPHCSHLIRWMPHLLQVFFQYLLRGFACRRARVRGAGGQRGGNPLLGAAGGGWGRQGNQVGKGRQEQGPSSKVPLTLLGLFLGGLAAGVGDAGDGLDLAFADWWGVQHQLGGPCQADGQPSCTH